MQDYRTGSTLELVVDEQQLQGMSQIDLGRRTNNLARDSHEPPEAASPLSFETIRRWPGQLRHSLGAKLDEAKAKSDSRAQFALELVRAFSGLAVWLVCFLGTIVVPLVLLLVGLLNLDECEVSPALPYYLFTIGFIMTVSNLFNLALALDLPILANHRLLASDIKSIIASVLNIMFNATVAFVYVLTAHRVFTLAGTQRAGAELPGGEADANSAPLPTCNETLLSLSFWFVALTLGSVAAFGLLGTLLFAYNRYRLAIIRGSAPRPHSRAADTPSGQAPAGVSPAPVATSNRL